LAITFYSLILNCDRLGLSFVVGLRLRYLDYQGLAREEFKIVS